MAAFRAALRPAVAVALAIAAAGCASSGGDSASRGPSRQAASATPWVVPAAEHDSQRLFRARLESEEGRGRFRLLLRMRDPARYQIRATHPLFNRRLWSLDVDGDAAVLVDHQQRTACRYQGEAEIGAIPLGPFPFDSLPALLLGYLPLPPADAPERAADGGISFFDALGRHWTAAIDGGAVRRWELHGDDTVTWEKQDDWYVLQAVEERLDLRWKETLREPVTDPLRAIEVPTDYADGPCDLGWLRGVEDAPWEEDDEQQDG